MSGPPQDDGGVIRGGVPIVVRAVLIVVVYIKNGPSLQSISLKLLVKISGGNGINRDGFIFPGIVL